MPTYTQAGRPMSVVTPLGTDALLLEGFSGTEAISAPFRFHLDLLAESRSPIAFDRLLGQKVTVFLYLPTGKTRSINGVVVRLGQGPHVQAAQGSATFIRYRAEIVPQFWLLTRRVQSRIFQQKSVPEILKIVLANIDLADQTLGTFQPRDYCVQYNESDFDFASRLMEEEGIYYFFKHTESDHKMVLANTPLGHPDIPGPDTLLYEAIFGGTRPGDRIHTWEKFQEICSGKYTLWDYCFEMPDKSLEASHLITESVRVGTVSHKLKIGGNDRLEVYEYPGGYAQRFDGVAPGGGEQASNLQKIFDDNERTAGIRMQQESLPGLIIEGTGNVRHLVAGHKFTLDGHYDADGEYVLTRVEHEASLSGLYLQGAGDFLYSNRFQCIPAALPFRPARTTPRPKIHGPQTAVVVGPKGQEIFTDKYGRVKVQFPWDREGAKDAGSSCWIRVASTWAGKRWGSIQIPRIGQEVVVAFEEGDPDRPLIIGSVYNAEQMPPYTLPEHMTQSGTLTRSSAKGTADNFNQLRFEDKKGSEEVYFHAERDFHRVVENNDTLKVGSDDRKTCPDGSQTISIYKDRTTTIETGNETLTVKQGDRTVTIDQGNDNLKVSSGNQSIQISEGSSTIEAGQSITLKVGGNSIVVNQQGVTVQGATISIQGQTMTEVKGGIVNINC